MARLGMISRIASFSPSLRCPREELFRGSDPPRAIIAILAVPRSAAFYMGARPSIAWPDALRGSKGSRCFPNFVSFTVARVDYTPGKVLKLRISPAPRQRE